MIYWHKIPQNPPSNPPVEILKCLVSQMAEMALFRPTGFVTRNRRLP